MPGGTAIPASGSAKQSTASAAGEQLVRLGAVDVEDPPYHFQLFLNAAGTKVVACLGVDQHLGHRLKPGDQALLDCQAVEWVDTEWPGWIRVTFADAAGRAWSLVDKVPVLTEADIDPHEVLPKLIHVGCQVTEVARDDPDSPLLLTVSTVRIRFYGTATASELRSSSNLWRRHHHRKHALGAPATSKPHARTPLRTGSAWVC